MNDIQPNWDVDEPKVPHGTYFWEIEIWNVTLPPNMQIEKPYVRLFYHVLDGDQKNFKNSFKIYLNPKARTWAVWFLTKFEYPKELLQGPKPAIRKSALIGLKGKIQVDAGADDRYGDVFEVKGFERIGEDDLEKRFMPKGEVDEVILTVDEVPAIDINADGPDLDDLLG